MRRKQKNALEQTENYQKHPPDYTTASSLRKEPRHEALCCIGHCKIPLQFFLGADFYAEFLEIPAHDGADNAFQRVGHFTHHIEAGMHGGKAPATPCGAGNAGEIQRVAYSADYLFYTEGTGAKP